MNLLVLLHSCLLIGGTFTLIFGVAHFLLPRLFHWDKRMISLPLEMRVGLLATNFIFGVALSLMGLYTLGISLAFFENSWSSKFWVLIMCVLWSIRALYQFLYPQGRIFGNAANFLKALYVFISALFGLALGIIFTIS